MANIRYVFYNKKVVADSEYDIYLYFDSISEADKKKLLRCHLYDEKFFLEYYLTPIPLSSMKEVDLSLSYLFTSWWNNLPGWSSNMRVLKLKFPQHLAGGTFKLDFHLQTSESQDLEKPKRIPNINEIKMSIPVKKGVGDSDCTAMSVNNNAFSLNLTIDSQKGPSIKAVYWGKNEDIEYGKLSSRRSDTTVHPGESLYAHIHTEGLYGKEIYVLNGKSDYHPFQILDNTAVCSANVSFFLNSKNDVVFKADIHKYLPGYTEITPKLTYDSTKIKLESPVTSAVNVIDGENPDHPDLKSETFCRIDFRPPYSYDGSYGFSWYRVGDTQTAQDSYINDYSFLENIGFHYDHDGSIIQNINAYQDKYTIEIEEQINNTKRKKKIEKICYRFEPQKQMIENHMFDYQKILMPKMGDGKDSNCGLTTKTYLIPQMTIRKGKTVKLALYVSLKRPPKEYKFEFSNPKAEEEGYLSTNLKTISHTDIIGKEIQISCKKEFSKSVNLNVYAYWEKGNENTRTLCGSVRILPNDIMHQRNVDLLMVNVHYNEKGNKIIDGVSETGITYETLQKFYDQLYVNIHVIKHTIKLYDQADSCVYKYYQEKKRWPQDDFNLLTKKDKKNNTIFNYDKKTNTAGKLKGLFLDLIKYIPLKNKNCFEIILIPLRSDAINGYSSGDRFTVCFARCEKTTPAHELGHAFGLPHTFTGCVSRAKYVYQFHTTDNIMDYCHITDNDNGFPFPVDRKSFFYWQWKTMNALME
ncbi:MAG: hypothetical protein VZQ98_04825 [Bacteroidales bacterium]|nr:hypothetical protein [Bacteroidales bacterium]